MSVQNPFVGFAEMRVRFAVRAAAVLGLSRREALRSWTPAYRLSGSAGSATANRTRAGAGRSAGTGYGRCATGRPGRGLDSCPAPGGRRPVGVVLPISHGVSVVSLAARPDNQPAAVGRDGQSVKGEAGRGEQSDGPWAGRRVAGRRGGADGAAGHGLSARHRDMRTIPEPTAGGGTCAYPSDRTRDGLTSFLVLNGEGFPIPVCCNYSPRSPRRSVVRAVLPTRCGNLKLS